METTTKMDQAGNLQANPQEDNNNEINVEETTSISEQPFFQTLNDSVENIKKQFEETTTSDDAVITYEQYNANITSTTNLINSPFVPIGYVWDKFLPQGELCLIYGDSASFKSTLARCILFAIAYGMDEYLGFKIDLPPERRKVCLVITEDSLRSIKTLIQMQAKYFEQFRTIENPVFDIISDCENGIIETLEKRLRDVSYSMIVEDTPQDDIVGSMNDNNVVRSYLNQLSSLGSKYNCTILGIHHKRKYTLDKAPTKEDLSGTRAFGDKPRSIFELRRVVDQEDCVYLTPMKNNYQENVFLKNSYKLILDKKTLTFTSVSEIVQSDRIHLSAKRQDNTKAISDTIIKLKAFNPNITQAEIAEILMDKFPDETFSQSKVSKFIRNIKNINN
ncbi:MAG: AAA family ATPase [Bacteroidales bacterium]|nr:AAA family ATPase [Bacteroidales bacterium]MDD4684947.1 AAA family ATPase [Bacteroidales bacterium]